MKAVRQLILVLASALLILMPLARADNTSPDPNWTAPAARTVKLVGPATDIPDQADFVSNIDCSAMTFRQPNSGAMQAGCFTPTAYGWMDPDAESVVFNGSDEALPLLAYSPHQVLTPWPNAGSALTLDATNTGGSYLGMYRDLTGHLKNVRNALLELTAKQINAPPDFMVDGPDGLPLVVNAQTLAFSRGGSWLVAESMGGSFVRLNLASLDSLPFARSYGSLGSPALLKSQVAVSHNGRYVAIENSVAGEFIVYDLASCSGATNSLRPATCAHYDYWPFVQSALSQPTGIQHLRFVNDGVLSFNATLPTGTFTYLMAPAATIPSLLDYLALGDSYTSGEGAFDYSYGTDTADNMCHRSLRSYPYLIINDLYGAAGGQSVACSGAVIRDIAPDKPADYRGQARGSPPLGQRSADDVARLLADYTPGNLAQIDFATQYQPGVLSVSVSGDDIGFGDLIVQCVAPHISLHLSDSTCFDTYEDRLELKNLIDRTVPRLVTLYKQVRQASPLSRIYVIDYPQIAVDTGSCALNVHLGRSEVEFANELVDYLNGALRLAASQAHVGFIDISQALAGHRLCETKGYDVAVNGLTAGRDAGPFGLKIFAKESYHPNGLGQALMAAAIEKQSSRFGDTTVAAAGENPSQTLLNVPKTGRAVNNLQPAAVTASPVIKPGDSVALGLAGGPHGLVPNQAYAVKLDGPGGTPVGTVSTNAGGDISDAVVLPGNTPGGWHTIDVIGPTQDGSTGDLRQPVYVPADSSDDDGDGVTDTTDSCPGVVNSGSDYDHDGIDDSCDPEIGSGTNPDNGSGAGSTGSAGGSPSPGGGSTSGTSSSSGSGSVSGSIDASGSSTHNTTSGSQSGTTGQPQPGSSNSVQAAGSTPSTRAVAAPSDSRPTTAAGRQGSADTPAATPVRPTRPTLVQSGRSVATGQSKWRALWLGIGTSLFLLWLLLLLLLLAYIRNRYRNWRYHRAVRLRLAWDRGS